MNIKFLTQEQREEFLTTPTNTVEIFNLIQYNKLPSYISLSRENLLSATEEMEIENKNRFFIGCYDFSLRFQWLIMDIAEAKRELLKQSD